MELCSTAISPNGRLKVPHLLGFLNPSDLCLHPRVSLDLTTNTSPTFPQQALIFTNRLSPIHLALPMLTNPSGNDFKVIVSQFEQLHTQPLGPSGYDLTTLIPFRSTRFNQSINNKPYFFNGPLSGVLVQPAAYTFIYRFLENKSAEYPNGYLNSNVLKSFSITGEPGSFVWTEGHEKISDNWYKRALGDEYTITYFLDPEFLDIGGNTGETYTFNGVDIEDLTGGVFNAATLLEGDNLG